MNGFWETKTLTEMSREEWESLGDSCGKCCLIKLEDEDNGDIAITNAVCELIDLESCRCTRYDERCSLVPECIDLKQHDFAYGVSVRQKVAGRPARHRTPVVFVQVHVVAEYVVVALRAIVGHHEFFAEQSPRLGAGTGRF